MSSPARPPDAPFLVLGFGPFGEVVDNPSRRLALALDGARVGGRRVVGREMPVLYGESVALTERLVLAHQPAVVLGIGVAVRRQRPEVERFGRPQRLPSLPDVAGRIRPPGPRGGPGPRAARGALAAFAQALGAGLSEDAGQYVCNAWLHDCLDRLEDQRPVLFLHLPPAGLPPERLLRALPAVLGGGRGRVG